MPFVQKWGSFQAMAALEQMLSLPQPLFQWLFSYSQSGSWVGDMSHVKWEHSITQQQGSNPRHLHPNPEFPKLKQNLNPITAHFHKCCLEPTACQAIKYNYSVLRITTVAACCGLAGSPPPESNLKQMMVACRTLGKHNAWQQSNTAWKNIVSPPTK